MRWGIAATVGLVVGMYLVFLVFGTGPLPGEKQQTTTVIRTVVKQPAPDVLAPNGGSLEPGAGLEPGIP